MKSIPYYERDVDFSSLAEQDPDFASVAQQGKRNGFIDFQNPKIVQQLTKTLLKSDFDLTIQMPEDRLCPPVPVRWNYVRWIQDLLDTTSTTYRETPDGERQVFGLDIGVGASCIYALLACSTREEWRMAGTDIDAQSLEWAQRNVRANGLSERIKLKRIDDAQGKLLPLDQMGVEEMDFTMTNPPFYSSQQDFEAAFNFDTHASPSAVCTGAENEMICAGGDVGFVTRILEESLLLKERVQWYTAMLSKLSSLQQIVAKFKEHDISNYAVTSLHPGHRTKRWAVAWSFGDLRPRNDISRHGELVLSVLPPPTAQTIKVPLQDAKWSGRKINETLESMEVRWMWRPLHDMGVMECKGNVWSRAARRKKQFASADAADESMAGENDEEESDEGESVALAAKVTCKAEEVEVQWLRGQEQALFISFCGMLKRALSQRG